MEARAVRYKRDDGNKVAIVKVGRKKLHVITIEPDVRVKDVPRSEERYLQDIGLKVGPTARAFRRIGRLNGITKGAARALRGL